eukprot:tig00020603_g11743.t1
MPSAAENRLNRKDRYEFSWRVLEEGYGQPDPSGATDRGPVYLSGLSGAFGTCAYNSTTRTCTGTYAVSKNYLWVLAVPEGYTITLEFLFFETERDWDFVSVYDAADLDPSAIVRGVVVAAIVLCYPPDCGAQLLAKASGSLAAGSRMVYSTGRFMAVQLESDSSAVFKGIYCRYTATAIGGVESKPPTDPGCNPVLRSRAGPLTVCSFGNDGVTVSRGMRNKYMTWTIAPACGGPIGISFESFAIQPFSGDRLQFLHGETGQILFSEPSPFPSEATSKK